MPGSFELLGDLDSLGDINAAVSAFGGVVQFAQGSMTGAGVIPGVGTFLGDLG